MRILYFNYLWDIQGASLGSAIKPMELFAALEKLGHEVKICWLRKQPNYTQTVSRKARARHLLKRHCARFVHDPKLLLENIVFARKEQELVAAHQPDLIVSRLDFYLFSALKTAQKFGLPMIIEADSPPIFEAVEFQKQYWHAIWLARLIERQVLQQADYVIMQSKVLEQHFIKQYGLEKTAVVTNAADPLKFDHSEKAQELVQKYGINDHLVLGFVGSMSVWHGVEHLLKLIRVIVRNHPQVKFLLVGSGGEMGSMLKKAAQEPDLSGKIILPGYVPYDEIPAQINLMDIVLAPYPKLEFFYYSPVKIFEYMAAGKAVVTSRIGQINEIITDGENGLLCDPGDFQGLVAAVERLLKQPELRRQIGLQARITIAQKHTWLHKAREWEQICNRILSGRRS